MNRIVLLYPSTLKCGKLLIPPRSILKSCGFCPVFMRIPDSCLFNMFQCIKVRESFSSLLPVFSGVTQGSFRGPILFILFINDLTDAVQHGSYFLFADDLTFQFLELPLIQGDVNAFIDRSF